MNQACLPPEPKSPPKLASQRFLFIDALRGLAALAVVLFHLGWVPPLRAPLSQVLPAPLLWVIANGHLGVAVFFVLSGFVIAHSLRDAQVTWQFFGRFALRRSLRLDPPYWLAIVVAVLVLGAAQHLRPDTGYTLPSAAAVLAHIAYAQNIVGIPNIVSQFWTLPYELQFYLVYCGHLAVEQGLLRRNFGAQWARLITFGPLALLSLGLLFFNLPAHGMFFLLWYCFLAGALVQWSHSNRAPLLWWALFCAGVAACGSLADHRLIGVLVTSATLAMAARAGGLTRWFRWRWLQWLGRISYSLYLTHFLPAAVSKLSGRWVGDSGPRAVLALLVLTALCLGVAWLFYLAVERPSLRWAQQADPIGYFRERRRSLVGDRGSSGTNH